MTVKLTLCVFIILLSFIAGKLLSKPYDSRVYHLQSLLTAIGILEAEMKYRMDPLKESFIRVSKLCDGYTLKLFSKASELLKERDFLDFSSIWSLAVDDSYKGSSLTVKDLQIIKDMGLDLGKTDMSGQNNAFNRIKVQLNEQLLYAQEVKKTKGKMLQSISLAIGFLVVIIII